MKTRTVILTTFIFSFTHPAFPQAASPAPTASGFRAAISAGDGATACDNASASESIHQYVSYSDSAPDCGVPTVTVQTLTNPFSEACSVFISFGVDDDILINGQEYQSPGTDFTFHDENSDPCPDANGTHADQYCGFLDVGEQITLGVRNNFRGQISLSADVYFNTAPVPSDDNRTTEDNDDHSDDDPCHRHGMASYFIHLMLASLHIEDTPISYNPPRGSAIEFRVAYNQREAHQPDNFDYSNFGPKWTFNWLSYVIDNPVDAIADASVYVRGGGTEVYRGFHQDTQSYQPEPQSQAVLVRTSGLSYEKRFRDGSKEVFSLSDSSPSYPRRIFLTSVVDSAGNAVTLSYDSGFRLISITDSLGQSTVLSYDDQDQPLRVTKVTDPFGRYASFGYTGSELSSITDPVGIESQFHYTDGTDFIDSMTTPYGTTTFASGENGDVMRWVEATDPRGGKERVEYNNAATGVSATDAHPPAGAYNVGLDRANTFYWDKRALLQPRTYNTARVIHWLKSADGTQLSGIKHSEKRTAENRVWYTYPGQTQGGRAGTIGQSAKIARILDDGSEQDWQFAYNALGNVTRKTDPVGRITSYAYDTNGIDLLTVYQRNSAGQSIDPDGASADIIVSHTYNSQHKPLTEADAAGQTTNYSYNSYGQLTSSANAKHEITTYTYSDGVPNGYLASITGPSFNNFNAVTSFTYDSANRVRTVTAGPDNYSVTTDYDNLDRTTQISYPDGTTRQFQYVNADRGMTLDLTASKDRLDRWTNRHYNANRQLDSMTDPSGATTHYEWCTCGALTSISDPNQNVTFFDRDLQSRLIRKRLADGNIIYYEYEHTTSRLANVLDANVQQTFYTYFADDNIQGITYRYALNPTPNASYSYDPNYNRIASMSDGIGTTNYAYYPVAVGTLGAGRLYQVSGPLPTSTITYGYDELGRVTSQDINGTGASLVYDSLGRVQTTTNGLGTFGRTYESDVTPRLATLSYPNGQTANYHYFGNANDRRLQTIGNLDPSSNTLSEFDYIYDPEGQIQALVSPFTSTQFNYDASKRLTGTSQYVPGLHFIQPYGTEYDYDAAGNRLSNLTITPVGTNGSRYAANNLNQLSSVSSIQEFGTTPITYDANGNMTYDGNNQTFEWDAANRLVAINYIDSGNRTEFAYDGLGRRVKITEYAGITTALIEPNGGIYMPFSTEPFTVPAGNYTIVFQSVDPNGYENAALLDAVTLNGALVPNGSFETPVLDDGTYEWTPSEDPTWSYLDNAGITANGSVFSSANPPAPDGRQVAFLDSYATIWQTLTLPAGTYTLSFQAAQAVNWNYGPNQQFRVTVRGADVNVKTFVWCGNTICEERDAAGSTTTKRFFAEGEQRVAGPDAGNYYYSRDHLGSIREVTDSSGHLVTQLDYDAWGNEAVVSGTMTVDFGFTGHYFHQPSGLNLSKYRAYNPALGRWISRDPLENAEMSQGPNLYAYVKNDPINSLDLLGLFTQAELDAAHQIALSGLLLRREQLVALLNGDIESWEELQCEAVPEGNAEEPLFRNPAVDAWEATNESQNNANGNNATLGGAMWSGLIFGDAEFNALLQRTENEAMRQILLLRWLNGQTAD